MKTFTLIFFLFFNNSCAHHKDVRPGASGLHKVKLKSEDSEEGARYALKQANYFCEKRKKSAAIVKETIKYTGSMNEEDYKRGKKASKAAEVIGGSVYLLGDDGASKAGGVLGLGGAVADVAMGKGYTIIMKFKCM